MIMMTVLAFILGIVIGSFLNVCVYRLPRNLSVISPGSSCASCGAPIRPWDNIPLISYIILRGKCRNCGSRISFRYPVVEMINGLLYAGVFLKFGVGWHLPFSFLFVSAMVVITFIDLEFQIIPNVVTIPGIIIGLAAAHFLIIDPFSKFSTLGFMESLIGIALGGAGFFLIAVLSRGGMGGGDVKMMAMVGAFTGWKGVFLTTLIGSVVGSVIGVGLMLFAGADRKTKIPFGPFLALGSIITLFFGGDIFNWFFSGIAK